MADELTFIYTNLDSFISLSKIIDRRAKKRDGNFGIWNTMALLLTGTKIKVELKVVWCKKSSVCFYRLLDALITTSPCRF